MRAGGPCVAVFSGSKGTVQIFGMLPARRERGEMGKFLILYYNVADFVVLLLSFLLCETDVLL